MNPFKYNDSLTSSDYIIDRKKETDATVDTCLRGGAALLLGRRMVGKTTILNLVEERLRKEGHHIIKINSRTVRSSSLLHKKFVRGLQGEGIWDDVKNIIDSMEEPSVTTSSSYGASYILSKSRSKSKTKTVKDTINTNEVILYDLLQSVSEYARVSDKKITLLLDEVQSWRNIFLNEDINVIDMLHEFYDTNRNISVVFTGSQRRTLALMFEDDLESAFWGAIQNVNVEVPSTSQLRKFIRKGFEDNNLNISNRALDLIITSTALNTKAVQQLSSKTWAKAVAGTEADTALVSAALNDVLDDNRYAYSDKIAKLLEDEDTSSGVALMNRLYLGLAACPTGKVTSGEWMLNQGIPPHQSSNLGKKLKLLLRRGDVLLTSNNEYVVNDPLFSLWVRRENEVS